MKHFGIVKDGQFVAKNPKSYRYDIFQKEGQHIIVSIEVYRSKRSNDQNRYLWGVVYDLIAETTGHTVDEINEIMKTKFLTVHTDLGDYSKSSKSLNTVEFMEYIEQIRLWSMEYLGTRIPLPNEVDYEF